MYLVSFTRNPLNREWGSQAMHSTYAVISGHAPSATQVCILRWRACQECGKCMYSLYGFLFNPSIKTNGAIILQLSGKTNRDHSFFGKGFSKLKKRLRLGISKLYGTLVMKRSTLMKMTGLEYTEIDCLNVHKLLFRSPW